MSEWITKENSDFKLDPNQKYSVLKTYIACPDFTPEQKQALKDAVLKDDTTDEGQIVAKACEMLLPDAKLKEELWKQFNDADTKETLKDITLKIQCFFTRKQQLSLLEPYFDKYYDALPKVVETRNREFAEIFMNTMSPAFMARDSDLTRFSEMQKESNPEFFNLFLKK